MSVYLRAFNRRAAADASSLLFAVGTIAGIFLFLPGSGGYSLAWSVILGALLQLLFLFALPGRDAPEAGPGIHLSPRLPRLQPGEPQVCRPAGPGRAGCGAVPGPAPGRALRGLRYFTPARSPTCISPWRYSACPSPWSRAPPTAARCATSRARIAVFDRERTRKLLVEGFRNNLFLLAPLSILLIALANPIVSLLLERSQFSAPAVAGTTLALQFYAIGLMGWGLHTLTARIFAARLEGRSAMFLDLLLLAIQAPLAVLLARSPLGFAGIALATSVAYTVVGLLRVTVLERRLRREGDPPAGGELVSAVGKTLSACLLMVIAIIEAKFVFNRIQFNSRTMENIIFCVSLTFMGTAIYFFSSLLLKNTGILMFRKRSAAGRGKTPVSLLSPFRFLEAVAPNPDFYKAEYRYKISIYLVQLLLGSAQCRHQADRPVQGQGQGPLPDRHAAVRRGNGFLRRNALLALKAVNPWSEEIKTAAVAPAQGRLFRGARRRPGLPGPEHQRE